MTTPRTRFSVVAAVPHRTMALASVVGVVATMASVGSVASAAEPRPDVARGAVLLADAAPVASGGTVVFSGTGFATAGRGEVLSLKVDDGAVLTADHADVWGQASAQPSGVVTGAIELGRASAVTPLTPGVHWIRALVGSAQDGDTPRSVHATFTVVAAPAPTVTPPAPVGAQAGAPLPSTAPAAFGSSLAPATAPAVVQGGTVWLESTTLRRSRSGRRLAMPLRAGAFGSAGRVWVRARTPVVLGGRSQRRVVIARPTAYFVGRLAQGTVRIPLTPAGRTLLGRLHGQPLEATVTLVDASGESTVRQPVVIGR
jgi:hypothetical protein